MITVYLSFVCRLWLRFAGLAESWSYVDEGTRRWERDSGVETIYLLTSETFSDRKSKLDSPPTSPSQLPCLAGCSAAVRRERSRVVFAMARSDDPFNAAWVAERRW